MLLIIYYFCVPLDQFSDLHAVQSKYYLQTQIKNKSLMKKVLLVIAVLLVSAGMNAQILLQQDFSSGQWPPEGWVTFPAASANFALSQSNNAGGVVPEGIVKNVPSFSNATLRLISPVVNTTGISRGVIQFKHMFDHTDGSTAAVDLSIATRASSSAAWNVVWTKAATTDIAAETVTALANSADIGSATFQFCLVLKGHTNNFKNWYFDDIIFFDPVANDAGMASINVPIMFVGNKAVSGQVVNVGENPINSVNVNWSLSGGDVHTTNFADIDINTAGVYSFTCTDSIIGVPGVYDLKVWVSNMNGIVTADDNPANDTMVKNISIPEHLAYRRPMFEEFTSSTCAPCASFNNSVFNPFIATHGEEITLVKYQMNWPGSGDPYYTAEGGVRRGYYGVSGVPDLYVDGKTCGTSATAVNNAFNTSKATITYLDIESQHEIQGNNVIIDCNILPYANYSNVTIQIAVIEKVTTENATTNGETEFHHVMMKMVPDAVGSLVSLGANQPYNMKYTVDMSGTFVEDMTDLMVVIFVQASNKEILNSNYSVETGSMIVSMTPLDGSTNIDVNAPMVITFHQPVRMADGSALNDNNVYSVLTLKENNANGDMAGFSASVNSAKTVITVTPDPSLKYSQQYYLNIDELENNVGVNTIAQSTTFTTELSTVNLNNPKASAIYIYPNPASERIYIKSDEISKISRVELLNTIGRTVRVIENPVNNVNEISLKVSDLPSGIYFVRVISEGNLQTLRVLIAR